MVEDSLKLKSTKKLIGFLLFKELTIFSISIHAFSVFGLILDLFVGELCRKETEGAESGVTGFVALLRETSEVRELTVDFVDFTDSL